MRIIVRKVLTALGLKHSWRIAIKMRYVEPITMAQYLAGRREMMQWYADYIDSLRNGGNILHGNFHRQNA